jgi:hypothetical protein
VSSPTLPRRTTGLVVEEHAAVDHVGGEALAFADAATATTR